MKQVYFISDAHLGSWAIDHRRMQERRLVRFLDDIKEKAQAIYMLGDMFDYWYEYKYVVPKGYTRFLGKISELTDRGIEVHYFIGNHDIWTFGYLERECGVILHREPMTVEIMGKEFFLAHGDGMGDPDPVFRFMRGIFRSRFCRISAGLRFRRSSARIFFCRFRRFLVGGHFLDHLAHDELLVGVKPVRRLVHYEHLRIVQDRLGEARTLTIALRERVDRLLGDGGKLRLLDGCVNLGLCLCAREATDVRDERKEVRDCHGTV